MDRKEIHALAKKFINQEEIQVHEMLYLIGQAMEYESTKQELAKIRQEYTICSTVSMVTEGQLENANRRVQELEQIVKDVTAKAQVLCEDLLTLGFKNQANDEYLAFVNKLRVVTSIGEFSLGQLVPVLIEMKKDLESIDPEELRAALADNQRENERDEAPF